MKRSKNKFLKNYYNKQTHAPFVQLHFFNRLTLQAPHPRT